MAEQIFEESFEVLESYIADDEDELTREAMEESFHDKSDYIEAYERTKRLLFEARSKIVNADAYELLIKYEGVIDEDYIYEEWIAEIPTMITRAV